MRWDQLFADLEAQWEAEARRDLDSEVADRTRRERAAIGVYERLAASVGVEVRLLLRSGEALSGSLADVGRDWLLLSADRRPVLCCPRQCLSTVAGIQNEESMPSRISRTNRRTGWGIFRHQEGHFLGVVHFSRNR